MLDARLLEEKDCSLGHITGTVVRLKRLSMFTSIQSSTFQD